MFIENPTLETNMSKASVMDIILFTYFKDTKIKRLLFYRIMLLFYRIMK
ncbi:hypothetical protein MARINOS108_10500 [Marinoscillum sp. 108]|nr:hypothetical protein MARINOS108_10500 [Marinoscillum sp. 108]